jgi:hypothetical protein
MKQVAAAFIKAKRAFSPALKDKTNPAFRSKYADLGACLEAVNEALLENGIAVYQETHDAESGVTVETILLHESGESLRCGKLHVPAAKQDPQGYGSALTYARRYSLMTACGIAPEDDDGNAGTDAKRREDERPPAVMDLSPKARAQRIEQGVIAGDAVNAAAAMDGWEEELRDSVWKLLPVSVRAKLTEVWPVAEVQQ